MTLAESRGSAGNAGSLVALTVTGIPAMGPNSYCLVSVGVSADFGVTSITAATGTFVKLVSVAGVPRQELWLGYNFGTGQPTSITINRAAGGAFLVASARVIDIDGNASILPTFATANSTGTSAVGTSGALTPAVGDIFVAGLATNSTSTDSTARTHTGNTFWMNSAVETSTNIRTESGWGVAQSAVSTSEAWTLAVSATWAGALASITPAAPPAPSSAFLVKGLTTYAADLASSY